MANYEWDETKRDANLVKHRLDFMDAPLVLESEERADLPSRVVEGEQRYITIAPVGERYFVVVYTKRNNAIRIISFRPASRNERRSYDNARREN